MTNYKELFGSTWFSSPDILVSALPSDTDPEIKKEYDLAANEKLIVFCILCWVGNKGYEAPSITKIAEGTSLSPRTVMRYIPGLEDRNMIQVVKSEGVENRYIINYKTLRNMADIYRSEWERYSGNRESTSDTVSRVAKLTSDRLSRGKGSPVTDCHGTSDTVSPPYKQIPETAAAFKGGEKEQDYDVIDLLVCQGFSQDDAVKLAYQPPNGRDQKDHNTIIRFQVKNLEMENECRRLQGKTLVKSRTDWLAKAIPGNYTDRTEKLMKIREDLNEFDDPIANKLCNTYRIDSKIVAMIIKKVPGEDLEKIMHDNNTGSEIYEACKSFL